jgi:hypothetical protein
VLALPGWYIPIPIALPNLAWALIAARSAPAPPVPEGHAPPRVLVAIEGVGRVAVFAVPFFLHFRVQSAADGFALAVAAVALIVYWLGWLRYFVRGRQPALLLAPLGGLPVPLAVAPVVYFLSLSLLARSALFGAVSLAFGLAHVSLSMKRWRADRHL